MSNLYEAVMEFVEDESKILQVLIETKNYDDGENEVRVIPTAWFLAQAKRVDYDSSYGGEVINRGLKIVFNDGSWIERHEYDGSEWFELKRIPTPNTLESPPHLSDLFDDGSSCPFNHTTIDGISINSPWGFGPFCEWHEEDGAIVLTPVQYNEKSLEENEKLEDAFMQRAGTNEPRLVRDREAR